MMPLKPLPFYRISLRFVSREVGLNLRLVRMIIGKSRIYLGQGEMADPSCNLLGAMA